MKKTHLILGAFVAIAASIFAVTPAHAAKEIQISPTKSEVYELSAGDVKSGSFNVNNINTDAFTFELEVLPYNVIDKEYNVDLEKNTDYNHIVDWIECSAEKYTLEPNESTKVSYKIKVPEDIPGGGQYAVISAKIMDDSKANGSNVKVLGRVSYIVYAHLDGVTRIEGNIINNDIPAFVLNPPIIAYSVVENTGNVDIEAHYNFQVFDAFSGHEVYSNTDLNITNRILPETQRSEKFTWDNAPMLGLFKVKQTIEIAGQTSTTETLVFICPIWLIFIVLFLITLMVFWLISRARARKREQ